VVSLKNISWSFLRKREVKGKMRARNHSTGRKKGHTTARRRTKGLPHCFPPPPVKNVEGIRGTKAKKKWMLQKLLLLGDRGGKKRPIAGKDGKAGALEAPGNLPSS